MVVDDEVEQVFVGPVGARDGAGRPTCWSRPSGGWRPAATPRPGWRSWWGTRGPGGSTSARAGSTDGDLPYEVSAGGQTFVSPCRRYVKRVIEKGEHMTVRMDNVLVVVDDLEAAIAFFGAIGMEVEAGPSWRVRPSTGWWASTASGARSS